MIALLRGELYARDGNRAVIDVGGVGYEVFAPQRALDVWQRAQDAVVAHVSTQVREDAITLYGFASPVDRHAFQVLMSVSGIGPKLALACLDALAVESLVRAVENDDVATLSRIPGVGKKTAQRLALELKGKLPVAFEPAAAPLAAAPVAEDTLALALVRLGYSRAEIERARQGLADAGLAADAPVAERLRAALKLLYRQDA